MTEPAGAADRTCRFAAYLLVGRFSGGLYECHVYSDLAADEQLEVVAPDGDVFVTWPSERCRPAGDFVASGARLFLDRADLDARIGPRR